MPPHDTSAASSAPTNRKRTNTERVVPAIPLAFSKPKHAKSKSRPEAEAKNGVERIVQDVQPIPAIEAAQEQPAPIVNGDGAQHDEDTRAEDVLAVNDAVTMPAADTPGSRGSAAMSLSFGGTPEMPPADSPALSTSPPSQPQPPSSATSPASSRKPNEGFDMRQIRTELPPAFVPSAGQHTPKSSTSSQFNRPTNIRPQLHPNRPSAGNIVFGSQDSSTSSPAPPQSAGSAFASPTHPTFGAGQIPYFVPQGHAHHSSEPHTQRAHHAAYPQPAMLWYARHGYMQYPPQQSVPHPQAQMPFRYPTRDTFAGAESQQVNGRSSRSRSASQTSSTARDQQKRSSKPQSPLSPDGTSDTAKMMLPPEPKAAFQAQTHPRPPPYNLQHHMPPPPQFQHPDVAASIANAEAIRDHVLSMFSNASFSDCRLLITDDNETQQSFDGHKMVLSRSPTLLSLIQNNATSSSSGSTTQVNVSLKGRYMRTRTLLEAIKYLYGGPLLQLDHQRPGSAGGQHIPSNVERMDSALQNIAIGAWLNVYPIANRGVEVVAGLLHWETIPTALAFALDGGLGNIWNVEDGSEDRASISSGEDSPGRSSDPATAASSPTYDPYSTHLLRRIVDFLVHVFPINFYLNTAAPQLPSSPRLPPLPAPTNPSTTNSTADATRPLSNPLLSQIRFGDIMPVDDPQRPSFATTTLSSILLSLPFQVLKCLLEHYDLAARLGPETVASIMRQVVAEREARRIKVLNARLAGGQQQREGEEDKALVGNLFWGEFVESSAMLRAGFRLARRRRDIDTPPSSGACSERNK